MTFPGAFPGSYRGRTNDIKTRRSTATAPPTYAGMCARKSQCYFRGSLPRCATQRMFLHGHSWILNFSFFQVEEPSRFQGLHPGRKGKAISGSHCTHNTPRPYETNYTQTKDTHSTQLDTLKHTLRELGRQSALASPQPGFLERVPRYVT